MRVVAVAVVANLTSALVGTLAVSFRSCFACADATAIRWSVVVSGVSSVSRSTRGPRAAVAGVFCGAGGSSAGDGAAAPGDWNVGSTPPTASSAPPAFPAPTLAGTSAGLHSGGTIVRGDCAARSLATCARSASAPSARALARVETRSCAFVASSSAVRAASTALNAATSGSAAEATGSSTPAPSPPDGSSTMGASISASISMPSAPLMSPITEMPGPSASAAASHASKSVCASPSPSMLCSEATTVTPPAPPRGGPGRQAGASGRRAPPAAPDEVGVTRKLTPLRVGARLF